MSNLVVILDRQENVEQPAHPVCAADDPQRYEFKRTLTERDHWAKSCGICRRPSPDNPAE